MNYLLDTHAFIWLDSASSNLSPRARALVGSSEYTLFLSLVSIWEIQIKHQLGKLDLRLPLSRIVNEQQTRNSVQMLSIEASHIYALAELPDHHRDPFDRLLIAQAMIEKMPLISQDSNMNRYNIEVFW